MTKSKARKRRDHRNRNLGRGVTLITSEIEISTHVRKTKTKREKLNSTETKYRKQFHRGDESDGIAFLFAIKRMGKRIGMIKVTKHAQTINLSA